MSDNSVIARASQYQNLWGMQAEQAIIALLGYWGLVTQPPVLVSSSVNTVSWTSAATPPVWNIISVGNGLLATVPGSTMTYQNTLLPADSPVYVQGYTSATGNPVTQPSNRVTVP